MLKRLCVLIRIRNTKLVVYTNAYKLIVFIIFPADIYSTVNLKAKN